VKLLDEINSRLYKSLNKPLNIVYIQKEAEILKITKKVISKITDRKENIGKRRVGSNKHLQAYEIRILFDRCCCVKICR